MLFDEITRLPEYYLTRSERQILRERAADIVSETGADTMVELGCGLSEKTKVLLDAFRRRGNLSGSYRSTWTAMCSRWRPPSCSSGTRT